MFNLFRKKADYNESGKLPFQVEVHCHVLPGIDDGSKTVESSVEIVGKLQSMGIRKIIATPHITNETFPNTKETIEAACNLLKPALIREGIDVELVYSAEYRLDELFDKIHAEKALIPFPKSCVLIENSFIQPYWALEKLIFDMQTEQLNPIIAHIERYAYYYDDKKKVEAYKQQGCLFQVNLLSFTGYYGLSTRDFALWLLSEGMIDFMGTDVHNMRQLHMLETFLQGKTYKKIAEQLKRFPLKNDLFLTE
jgi:protein-tyrosine phosphatase